jgi:hypothetical protein
VCSSTTPPLECYRPVSFSCFTTTWCLLSWSTLAKPPLFGQPGRWHLNGLSCFCRCALGTISDQTRDWRRIETTHRKTQFRSNTTIWPLTTPPFLHPNLYGHVYEPFPRTFNDAMSTLGMLIDSAMASSALKTLKSALEAFE